MITQTARDLLGLYGLSDESIDAVLRVHARGLADLLRTEADDLHQTTQGVVQGLRLGADLIAPDTGTTTEEWSRVEILKVCGSGKNVRNSMGHKAVAVPIEVSGVGTVELCVTPDVASDIYREVSEE